MNTSRIATVVFVTVVAGPVSVGLAQTACSASAFGPVTQDPITISGPWTIGNNCTLNFGFRHVILDPTATLNVTNATILSGQLTVAAGAAVISPTAVPSSFTVVATPAGPANGSVEISGNIDLSSAPSGGTVTINAGGAVSILGATGRIAANGLAAGDIGGSISVSAVGDITVDGAPISLAARGFDAAGGDATLHSIAGSLAIAKSIDASGLWEGGLVALSALATITTWGEINANARTVYPEPPTPGQAGTITVSAGSFIAVHGDLRAAIDSPFCCGYGSAFGSGGSVVLDSGGGIDVHALIDVQGGADIDSTTMDGGRFVATADANYRQLSGGVIASSRYYLGSGGIVSIAAGGSIELYGFHEAGYSVEQENPGNFGSIEVHGSGGVTVIGPLKNQGSFLQPWFTRVIGISSTTGDVTVSGPIDIQSASGGVVEISAGGHLSVGTVYGSTYLEVFARVVFQPMLIRRRPAELRRRTYDLRPAG